MWLAPAEAAKYMNDIFMASTDQQVRERRIQLLPLFEDYDPVHSGCVSHSQVSSSHYTTVSIVLYSSIGCWMNYSCTTC